MLYKPCSERCLRVNGVAPDGKGGEHRLRFLSKGSRATTLEREILEQGVLDSRERILAFFWKNSSPLLGISGKDFAMHLLPVVDYTTFYVGKLTLFI